MYVWCVGGVQVYNFICTREKRYTKWEEAQEEHELACFRHSTAPNTEVTKLKGLMKQLLRHRLRCAYSQSTEDNT